MAAAPGHANDRAMRSEQSGSIKPRKRTRLPTQVSHVTTWAGAGYRDLLLVLKDSAGNEYELRLPPEKMQSLINSCADVTSQISDHPPLDWDQYRAQIHWPQVTPWMNGPAAPSEVEKCA